MEGNAAAKMNGKEPISQVDVKAIMARIRAQVEQDLARQPKKTLNFESSLADFNNSPRRAGELLNCEELRFLNVNHSYPLKMNLDAITSHRAGIFGKLLVRIKRKIMGVLWNQILKDYFTAERDFQANLVRYLNDVAKYVDARDAANFWELIRKVDVDLAKAMDRIERASDEQTGTTLAAEKRIYQALSDLRVRIDEVGARFIGTQGRLNTVENVVSGLESIVARQGQSSSDVVRAENVEPQIDHSYLLLENRFRGSEEEIRKRVAIYPEVFRDAGQPVLEIGAGRGELQELFREQQIPSYGVDLDEGMAQAAQSKGLDVRIEDGLQHLAHIENGSLGGVIAIQVVEHLSQSQLETLFKLCASKVKQGG
ncbi:MAG: class I SAM-dependent methyltransferase, partial [Bdellovibrionales bacterium]|nr:class I SAM-dependent methyltransferase [Bdellovibrionales bacterium]